MIGRLRGLLVEIGEADCLIDVMGVGYIVQAGARTLSRLPAIGDEVVVHVETQTREDGTRLFGFLTREERTVFQILQSIQGVGPKAALSVLDVLPPAELAHAVAREDKAAVARAQGVGPKLALRIVVELKGKALGAGLAMAAPTASGAGPAANLPPPSSAGEATAALMGLGIAEPAARRAVEQAQGRLEPDAPLPALIKAALQEIGR